MNRTSMVYLLSMPSPTAKLLFVIFVPEKEEKVVAIKVSF
jgi:hypothetical protein